MPHLMIGNLVWNRIYLSTLTEKKEANSLGFIAVKSTCLISLTATSINAVAMATLLGTKLAFWVIP